MSFPCSTTSSSATERATSRSTRVSILRAAGSRERRATSTVMTPVRCVTFGLLLLGGAAQLHAAPVAFQNPAQANWGSWSRGASGTAFAGWENFDAFLPGGFPIALPDDTPDQGASGVTQAVLFPNNEGAFITGSGAGGNIYSFSDINDFDVLLQPTNTQPLGPVTVALQISVLGTDISHASIKLNGVAWSERRVLATGTAGAPGGSGGSGTGVDNEYLYLWRDFTRDLATEPYFFDLTAAGSSNSLDALFVDVGPFTATPPVSPPPSSVPLPASGWLLLASIAALRAQRHRARR